MLVPDFTFCNQLHNWKFRLLVWAYEIKYNITVPLMDEKTCQFLDFYNTFILIFASAGVLINFNILAAYVRKCIRSDTNKPFTQGDVATAVMACVDFSGALLLETGILQIIYRPVSAFDMEISCSCAIIGFTFISRTTYLILIAIAIYRYVAICKRPKFFRWFSMRKMIVYSSLILAYALIQQCGQVLIICHYPIKWSALSNIASFNFSEPPDVFVNTNYDKLKIMWLSNTIEKAVTLSIALVVMTILYYKIVRTLCQQLPIFLDDLELRNSRRMKNTYIVYLIYVYVVMIPETVMEVLFTIDFFSSGQNWYDESHAFYLRIRKLVGIQSLYSSVLFLNPVTSFCANPIFRDNMAEFYVSILATCKLMVFDPHSRRYYWRWAKPRRSINWRENTPASSMSIRSFDSRGPGKILGLLGAISDDSENSNY